MNALELVNLSKTFSGKKQKTISAVKNVNLVVNEGEIFGFLGPNGAGKSTTIKMIIGLINPNQGHAAIMGHNSASCTSRKQVGYLPENPSFYDYLTAQEYLDFVGKTFEMDRTALRISSEKTLKLLDLWEARNRPIRGYSKGMVQRVGLAQTLIHDPAVYILDEPMSGLDPVGRALVKRIMLELKAKGKTVFFSTHITADVESVCDRVGIIVKGSLERVEDVGDVLMKGITAYHIMVKESRTGSDLLEHIVEKDKLLDYIAALQASGREIIMIEPQRKDLEAFFLETVHASRC